MGGLFVARIVIYKPRQWRHCYNDSLFRNEIFSVSAWTWFMRISQYICNDTQQRYSPLSVQFH